MLSMEPPECPVCLETYDQNTTTPRVLSCGHTTCESCLKQLPQKYPHTIRCPSCTQLVNLPHPQGPSALPKNIDLLRLFDNTHVPNSQITPKKVAKFHDFVPGVWSDEFYLVWTKWVLQKDSILVENGGDFGCLLLFGVYVKESKKVSLFRVTSCFNDDDDSVFDYSYITRAMKLLSGLREGERDELWLILNVCSKWNGICRSFGLWYNSDDKCVYLVCEQKCNYGSVVEKLSKMGIGIIEGEDDGSDNLENENGVSGFAMMGMEICEALIGLHREGLVIGCLGASCLSFDEFGHVCVDMNQILMMGQKVRENAKGFHGDKKIVKEKFRSVYADVLKNNVFVCPELFIQLLRNEGVECGDSSDYLVEYSSDVWSLACILLKLFIGEQVIEEIINHMNNVLLTNDGEHGLDYSEEKFGSFLETKLGTRYVTLSKILCQCLNPDPKSRPFVTDLWKCIRELIVKPHFDILVGLEGTSQTNNKNHCLVVGELCKCYVEINKGSRVDDGVTEISDRVGEVGFNKDIVDGVSGGLVKFIPMQGHLDCITGLAIGGGFLLSSSFDKTVKVWSLKDFSQVHSFMGHEHKVMAVVFVDGEQSLCISGDSGGGIFIWAMNTPFSQEPVRKWNEEKDWRYSGIHALAVSGTQYLYTGSGDKLIKAWSLLDYSLSCTMSGHKSVVSALADCDGVLYSGSWDGTVRLWSLNDHSALAVLGENVPGNVNTILSLSVTKNMLAAACDNGCIKIWRDDVFRRSVKVHDGAVFALCMEGKRLFSGGWDKTISVQELSGDQFHLDVRPIGTISCASVIPALLYWQGKLIVGCADRTIKMYYGK